MYQFMMMFTSQTQVRLSPVFLPRERSEPILLSQGVNSRSDGSVKIEIEPQGVGENEGGMRHGNVTSSNKIGFPMPKMEIPLFNGHNPRWWVRRCEGMFSTMWLNNRR